MVLSLSAHRPHHIADAGPCTAVGGSIRSVASPMTNSFEKNLFQGDCCIREQYEPNTNFTSASARFHQWEARGTEQAPPVPSNLHLSGAISHSSPWGPDIAFPWCPSLRARSSVCASMGKRSRLFSAQCSCHGGIMGRLLRDHGGSTSRMDWPRSCYTVVCLAGGALSQVMSQQKGPF